MQSEWEIVMIDLEFLGTLVNILRQEDLSGELVRIVFVPEPSSMHLSHHPIKTLLQLKVFSDSECREDIEQDLLANIEGIAPKKR